MARRRCHKISSTAEVFDPGKYTGLRWLDSASTPHLTLHPSQSALPWQEVRMSRFTTINATSHGGASGRPGTTQFLIVGWILTAVGLLCTVAGFSC